MFWVVLWKACLVGTLLLFSVLAVVVSVGGLLDVRKLLRRLADQPQHDPDEQGEVR